MQIGDLVTISGVAFGPQYGKAGMTNKCKRGQESVLVVTDIGFQRYHTVKPQTKRLTERAAPKQYGPKKRRPW